MPHQPLSDLSPLAQHVVANLSRVLPPLDPVAEPRTPVVWLFTGTDSATRLASDPAAMRQRWPAQQFAVTAVLPSARLLPWAVPDIRPQLQGCELLEIHDANFVAQMRGLQGRGFEVMVGGRLFVHIERRLFLSDAVAALMAEEDAIDYRHPGELALQRVADGIVHPLALSATGASVTPPYCRFSDAQLNFVPLSATERVAGRRFDTPLPDWYVGADPACAPEGIEHIDEDVVFLGAFSKHYGHFLLEGIARLWAYLRPELAHMKAVYIAEPGVDRFNDVFTFFGLPPGNLVKITRPTRFRSVTVPEQSMRIQDRCHPLYKATVDRIKSRIPAAAHRKVYFSKEMRFNHRGIGEKPMEDVFVRNGYALFYPERLSMFETIAILKGCESFAASSGTNAHNAIFLNDGARCISLNRSPHVHYVQTMIDRLKGLDAVYVEAHVSLLPASWSVGPFLFGPTRQLLDFFDYAGFAHSPDALRQQFTPHLLEFLRIWGLYYNDPQRRTHIDPSETRLPFDSLVAAVANTFAPSPTTGRVGVAAPGASPWTCESPQKLSSPAALPAATRSTVAGSRAAAT
jgi:hypothetical protein